MWHPFRWVGKDRAGHVKAQAAAQDAEIMVQKIDDEINRDKVRSSVLKEIRERNHLAQLFDEAFSMRRHEEGH
jgi:hypothetical protein